MKLNPAVTGVVAGLFFAAVVLFFLIARESGTHAATAVPVSLATDWSHHHVHYSAPRTSEQAWRLRNDPRYWQQLARRSGPINPPEDRWNRDRHHGGPPDNETDLLHKDWSENLGASALVGAGMYPAKYSFDISTANCGSAAKPDFVVYNTGLAGAAGQATIVAYDNLYSGCPSGSVPGTFWAYNTATGSKVTTSVSLSGDGTQVAFIQSTGTVASLVLLKWKAGTGTVTSPATPTAATAAGYSTCTAPCMLVLPLSGAVNDTNSAPFYDFTPGSDTIYVGDDTGHLHQFKGVFKGTPTESGSPWPVLVATVKLSSPVYDSVTGNVFVTTSRQTSNDSGSRLTAICATAPCSPIGGTTPSGIMGPTVAGTPCQAPGTSGDATDLILDAPILDSTAGKLYAVLGNDGAGHSAIYQFATNFALHTCGTEATLGTGSTAGVPVYSGAFDNQYFTSASGASPTGNLYVCGNAGGNPTLYQVPITAGVMGTPVAVGATLASATTTCSPISEIPNNNQDLIFMSVKASGTSSLCAAGGCILNYNVASWQKSTAFALNTEILDSNRNVEVVTTAGTSGAAAPTWTVTVGNTTADNGVIWLNQGPLTSNTTAWQSAHAYVLNTQILDTHNNIQKVITAGTSGGGTPAWNTTTQNNTADGTVTWKNMGPAASFALPASGGTSGIIMDNTVAAGTLPGASQVYYSNLGSVACQTGGTGGCAVQASQAILH